jgi:LPXTG-site transpeptidase (sortase) family protein
MANGGDSMFNSKYSNLLTVLLVIIIIAIFALIAFLGYDMYKKYYIDKDAEDFMEKYEEQIKNVTLKEETTTTNDVTNETVYIDPGNDTLNLITSDGDSSSSTSSYTSSSSSSSYTYKGFTVLGTIEIPKTGIKYPVLNSYSPKALETAVCYYYGPGLNEVGNTTIAGHNYRNGAFFGKNKQLSNGDIIYITDNSGKKVTYTIYNIYTTTPNDAEYITRDTDGKREISLTTCTDDSKSRLIIWAKEK